MQASLTERPTPYYRYVFRFCNASLPEPEKRIRVGTIHFAVRVDWSVFITGIAHHSVTDFGSQHPQDSSLLNWCQYFSSFTLSRGSCESVTKIPLLSRLLYLHVVS